MIRNLRAARKRLAHLNHEAKRWRHVARRCATSRNRVDKKLEAHYRQRHRELVSAIEQIVQLCDPSDETQRVAEQYLSLIRPWNRGVSLRQASDQIIDDFFLKEQTLLTDLVGDRFVSPLIRNRNVWVGCLCACTAACVVLLALRFDTFRIDLWGNVIESASRHARIAIHEIRHSSVTERVTVAVVVVVVGGVVMLSGVKKA